MRRYMFALMALALVFVFGYAVHAVIESRGRAEAMRGRYLVCRQRMEKARELAKEAAGKAVLEHGKRPDTKDASVASPRADRPPQTGGTIRTLFRKARERRREAFARRRDKAAEMPDREFTEAEQELMEVSDEAVSERDLATARDVATTALASKDPRVRLRAVETLSDFGEAGLPELADFLQDVNAEVASLAADRFELAVQDVEDETERVAIAKLGLLSLSDEDQLRSMAGTLIMSSDALAIVTALHDVICDGTPQQAEAAKEAYESQTGESWQGAEAADRWLRENYEPLESE